MTLNNKMILYYFFILLLLTSCKIGKAVIEEKKEEHNKCLITYIKGKTFLIDEQYNNISELKIGLNLGENDIIKTEKESIIELNIGEESVVRIKENSILKIIKLFKDQDIEETKLNLDIGKILSRPKNLTEGSSFEIETNSVTAGVRGTEFTVYKSEKGDAKIAVNEGEVYIDKNIYSEDINKIKKYDKELSENLESILQEELVLKKDEKLVVSINEYNAFRDETLNKIKAISENLEANKNSKIKRDALIKEAKEKTINDIQLKSSTIIIKEEVNENEWKNDFNRDEFKEIGTGVASISESKEEKFEKPIKEKETKKESTIEEKKEEKKEEITVIEKLPLNLGINLSEKNTSITSDGKNIYISNDPDKTIYCVDPEEGKLRWKFTDPKLNKIQSPATPFKNKVILATYSNIFLLNDNGKIIHNKEISNGPLYWASPIKYQNKIFIPSARYLYFFDGNTIDQIDESEFPAALSQLYISSDSNSIFAVDSLSCTIKIYSFINREIQWSSGKLPNNIFSAPVISGKYLVVGDIKQNLYRFDYQSNNIEPDILEINSGVLSNIISIGHNIYFVAKDGLFYTVNINSFNNAKIIIRVDNAPMQDKYLIKKLFKDGKILYFASDSGKLFTYDTSTQEVNLIQIDDNKDNSPLIGTPVKIKDAIYVFDVKANIYKRHKILM